MSNERAPKSPDRVSSAAEDPGESRHVARSNADLRLEREKKAYIDAELREASVLPEAELQVLMGPWIAPLEQAAVLIQSLERGLGEWIKQNREELAALRTLMQSAASKAGDVVEAADLASRNFSTTLRRLEELAVGGWTLPTQLSIAELHEFAQLEDAEAAGNFLMRKLGDVDPEFMEMEERLLSDPQLQAFSIILPQCFRSIRQGDFAIAVPVLIAVIDRIIHGLNPPSLPASTKVLKTLNRKGPVAEKLQHDLFLTAIFMSVATVMTDLWKEYPLQTPGAPKLSRHAIQHGRVAPPNSKREVVRLLNTLETALALYDNVDKLSLRCVSVKLDGRQQVLHAMFAAIFYLPRSK